MNRINVFAHDMAGNSKLIGEGLVNDNQTGASSRKCAQDVVTEWSSDIVHNESWAVERYVVQVVKVMHEYTLQEYVCILM